MKGLNANKCRERERLREEAINSESWTIGRHFIMGSDLGKIHEQLCCPNAKGGKTDRDLMGCHGDRRSRGRGDGASVAVSCPQKYVTHSRGGKTLGGRDSCEWKRNLKRRWESVHSNWVLLRREHVPQALRRRAFVSAQGEQAANSSTPLERISNLFLKENRITACNNERHADNQLDPTHDIEVLEETNHKRHWSVETSGGHMVH